MDVHTRLMKKSYKSVRSWWFIALLIPTIACQHYNESLQLPWWGVLLACGVALFFTLPIGIITATTNQVDNPESPKILIDFAHLYEE
ncbi:hypothetical protein SAY86_023837 [Trapa natans]|uniref:Uncharacterized protein n=1 Tax=Trapa natans TaxID=22666 RepID=A0AAN7M844_TRANT|nr:hypothetical protein SAY86_023837 [Trapa natans]